MRPATLGTWDLKSLLDESGRNVVSPGSRLSRLLLVGVLVGAVWAALFTAEWMHLRSSSLLTNAEWREVTVSPASTSATTEQTAVIDERSCLDLASTDGVEVVVALGQVRLDRYRELGLRSVPTVEAVWSTWPVGQHLDLARGEVPAIIGSDLAAQLGGLDRLSTNSATTLRFVSVLPKTLDAADLGGSVVIPRPAGLGPAVASCVVVARPERADIVAATAASALRADTSALETRRIAAAPQPHPYDAFLGRSSTTFALASVLVLCSAVYLIYRARSSELATYAVVGTTRLQTLVLISAEVAAIHGVVLASGLLGLVVADTVGVSGVTGSVRRVGQLTLLSLLASLVVGARFCRNALVEHVRER